MVAQVGAARIRAWNSGIAGIREVFHRRFTDHAYPKHTHGEPLAEVAAEVGFHDQARRKAPQAWPPRHR